MDYRYFFDLNGSTPLDKSEREIGGTVYTTVYFTVEELYQAFKARMIEEMAASERDAWGSQIDGKGAK